MSPEAVGFSVVIVNWNSREALAGCLASLAADPPRGGCEVIVVDNGSRDGSAEWLRGVVHRPSALGNLNIQLIANENNRGLPAANNQGLVISRGPLVLICNPDVVFRPGAIAALVDLLARRPRAAIAVPRLLYPDGRLQTSAGDLPTLSQALAGRQAQRRRPTQGQACGFWWDGWPHDQERAIGRGHEAAYLVRRAAIAEVGLQDEGFPLDWEGIDWTDRFRESGWEVWLCPGAEVVHLGGASIRQVPYRWIVSSHRGMYRYFAKRRPTYWRPVLATAITARAVTKLAATAVGAAMYERAYRSPSGEPAADGSPDR
ncbi:MAG: glycosyltransferase family 2 protein [Acidimicrobiales bacterium]